MGNETKLMRLMRSACLTLALLAPCLLAAQPVQEHTIKAAFVYNFVLFTEWPQDVLRPTDPFNLCVNAAGEMHDALMILNGKSAKGTRVKVLPKNSIDQDLGQCHVLYIESQDQVRWKAMRPTLSGKQILTIADNVDLGGAMITLHLHENKVMFDIDQSAARNASLTFSSKLLRLARKVK